MPCRLGAGLPEIITQSYKISPQMIQVWICLLVCLDLTVVCDLNPQRYRKKYTFCGSFGQTVLSQYNIEDHFVIFKVFTLSKSLYFLNVDD